jgi:hypothetical protein
MTKFASNAAVFIDACFQLACTRYYVERRDKTPTIARRSPQVMKTVRTIRRCLDGSHGTEDPRSAVGVRTVAGMAGATPRG